MNNSYYKHMSIDWRPFVDLVGRHQRFLITTHVRPDGDAIGCQKALGVALKKLGKQVRLVSADGLPDRYDFMDPERDIQALGNLDHELRDTEVFISVDTGTWNQLGAMADVVRRLSGPKAVVDHHATQDELGAVRFVDTTAEAAGRLVYEAVRALNVPVTAEIAAPLFVAIATDTGWFRHGNTTPATFALAQELMRAGAKPDYLYQQLFERITIPRLRLMGQVLARLERTPDGQAAHSAILQSDYAAAGARTQDGEDLVNFTVGLAGAPIGLLFTEMPNGDIKVSFRSRHGFDVGKIAESFGGGGHRQAAGATLKGTLDEVRGQVLQRIAGGAAVARETPVTV